MDQPEEVSPAVLNVKQVASVLNVSVRHVYRMADGGLMPKPLKLGGLNRWHRRAIDEWLAGGARAIRN
jgi:excisionase family DNA binding protein